MTYRHPTVLAVILFAVAIFFVRSPLAHAQTPEGIRISPAVVEDRAEPGDVFRFSLSITNLGETEKTFYLVTENIKGLDDQGLPIFATETEVTEYEMSSWIQVPTDVLMMKAGETKDVSFSVKVPMSASPGSHFAGVFLDMRPPKLRAIGAGIGVKVGSLVSLRISGEILEEIRLREFSTEKVVYKEPTVTFTSNVENLGNVLLRPQGFIEITDMLGTKVANLRVNESGAAVFPKGEKNIDALWEYDGFAFGRYQAVLTLGYGLDEKRSIYGTTSFWVLPLQPILWTLGTLFAFIVGLYFFVRMYIRNKLLEMGGGQERRIDTSYYAKKYQKSSSLLTVVVLAGFIVCIAFLIMLFVMFA